MRRCTRRALWCTRRTIQLGACVHEPGRLALQRSRHLSLTQQKSTLRLYDNRASPVCWDTSIVMPGSRVEIYRVITLAGRPGEWTKRERRQRVTHCSCAPLLRLVTWGSYTRDHGILSEIFFGAQQLRAKILSNSDNKPKNSHCVLRVRLFSNGKIKIIYWVCFTRALSVGRM